MPSIMGHSVEKPDTQAKVSGRAKYIADLYRPDMLFGAIAVSPHAHAKILSYDTSAAKAVEGVCAVITGDDVPESYMGPFIKDECALAKGKVRFVGEPVAAVAAIDEKTARKAALLVDVEYEELPAVLSIAEALDPSAPIIHEELSRYQKVFEAKSYGNVLSETSYEQGNVDQSWGECDVIVEGVFATQAQAHVSMEPCGALAEIGPDGRVDLWSANQSVSRVQANVCECLDLPMTKIRSRSPVIGGGFGNKMEAHVQPIVVALALAAKRPVKIILTREEDFEMVRARHPMQIWCKTGASADGRILAREVKLLVDGGAFSDDSPGTMGYSLLCARGPYRIPNVRATGKVVYTNHLRFGAMRGFGNVQMTSATETQLDEVAEKLSIDPISLREINALVKDERWFLGQKLSSCGFKECLERVRSASEWKSAARGNAKNAGSGTKRRGFGIAAAAHNSALLGTAAIVRLVEDGTVILSTGATDIGQGSDTVLTQICAEVLKIPMESIVCTAPDTDASPFNWGTTGSRVTYMTGRTVRNAATKVLDLARQTAAELLECNESELTYSDGGIFSAVGSDRKLSLTEVSRFAHWKKGGPIIGTDRFVFDQPTLDVKRAVAVGLPFGNIGIYSFNATVVEVEVDVTTGAVQLINAWTCTDVGKAINPRLVEGQLEGSLVQGLGMALWEEMSWDEGRVTNPSLMDYKVPGAMDVPYSIACDIVESVDETGPFGAKGTGEIGIVPVPAAVANAIHDAVGVRLDRLPMTHERVLCAIREASDKDVQRSGIAVR